MKEALSKAKVGDVFSFKFSSNKLRNQQTLWFLPGLFNAQPPVLSVDIMIEVIGRGKGRDHSPSLAPDVVELSLSGTTVTDSFAVDGIGKTGLNTQTFVAGTLLFPLKKLVFDGLATGVITNNIWTAKNPIVEAVGFGGNLDPDKNTLTFTLGASDDSFIVPEIVENPKSPTHN